MGYTGQKLVNYLQNLGIELSIVKRPKKWSWCAAGTEPPEVPGFTHLPKRWIVERTFAWIGKYRRLSKDYEYSVDSSVSMIFLALSRNLIRRMAKNMSNP
jgi:transposase